MLESSFECVTAVIRFKTKDSSDKLFLSYQLFWAILALCERNETKWHFINLESVDVLKSVLLLSTFNLHVEKYRAGAIIWIDSHR